jgi:hypothetical protein
MEKEEVITKKKYVDENPWPQYIHHDSKLSARSTLNILVIFYWNFFIRR